MSNILLVDDDPTARKVARLALEAAGHSVFEAADCSSAIEELARQPALALIDLMLPDGDGADLAARIRDSALAPGIPLLAMSRFVTRLEAKRGGATPFDFVLRKPVPPSELVRVVSQWPDERARSNLGLGRRLLVVEDDPVQQKLLRLQLELVGFDVATASDGSDALEQLLRSERFDAVVCDVKLPLLSGFGLLAEMHASPEIASTPVILVSAVFVDRADRELGRKLGASAYVLRIGTPTEQLEELLSALFNSFAAGSS